VREGSPGRGAPGDLIRTRICLYTSEDWEPDVQPGEILIVVGQAPYSTLPSTDWGGDPTRFWAPHIAALHPASGQVYGFWDGSDYDIFNRAEAHNQGE
jgi:hypothetical protein